MLFGKKKRNIVRLLLVEDEPLIAFDNEHFLTEASYTIVATVDRVADALAIIANSTDTDGNAEIDLVLVDGGPLFIGLGASVEHRAVDAAVLVLNRTLTGEGDLLRAREVLEAGGIPLLGLAETFVSTPFSGDPRHQRRIDMVADYERSGTPPPLPGSRA